MRPLSWIVIAGLAGLASGCDSPKEAKLYPVSGRVVVGDKVESSGSVQFRADTAKGNTTMEIPSCDIQADGSFELRTAGRTGAPPGWYRVLVLADNFKVVDPPPGPHWPNYPPGFLQKPLVNERYLYFAQTDLFIEVLPEPGPDAYVLKLNP